MTFNFQDLGWYLFADFLIIGALRFYAPGFLSNQNIIVFIASSIALRFLFAMKKMRF